MNFKHFFSKSVLIAILGLLWQPFAMSYQFLANVDSGQWRWISAQSYSNGNAYVVSSLWDIPFGHPAANEIILGSVQSKSPATGLIRLTSETGGLDLPINVEGVEYRLAGVQSIIDEKGAANTASTSSVRANVAEVGVVGTGLGDKRILLDKTQAPIQAFRPIVNIDTSHWITLLKDGRAKSGKYTGSFTVPVAYDYVRNGTRMHYTFSMPVRIILDYTSYHISSIEVDGTGQMTTHVDTAAGTVFGVTNYTVTLEGYFSNKLLIGLYTNNKAGGEFALVGTKEPAKTIPYNVTCENCAENKLIIQDGNAMIDVHTNLASMTLTNAEKTMVSIKVDFEPIEHKHYANDTYKDSFTLMFKVAI